MDKIGSIKKEIKHRKWREMYESYLSSGKTVIKWCAEMDYPKRHSTTGYGRYEKI